MPSRFRPVHGLVIIASLISLGVVADHALQGGFDRASFERVRPAADGAVHIEVADLAPSRVRFYRFLNAGNQEVRFFVGRDHAGELQVAFDASENHSKLGRGFRQEGDWMVDNKCSSSTRLDRVNQGGHGCTPIPLAFRLAGETVLIAEPEILRGWRYFR